MSGVPEHWNWTPEFRSVVGRFMVKVQRYGYVTNYEEVAHELGLAVMVLTHRLSMDSIDDPLGLTLVAELSYVKYSKRRILLKELRSLYGREIQEAARRRKEDARAGKTRGVRSASKTAKDRGNKSP